MGVADTKTINDFLMSADGRALELRGLVETADSVYLGSVGLDRKQPLFHSILGFNFSGGLSPDASFRVEEILHPRSGQRIHVAIFRQFNVSLYQDHPEDIIVGWYPYEVRAEGAAWVATMAALLGELLLERAAGHAAL